MPTTEQLRAAHRAYERVNRERIQATRRATYGEQREARLDTQRSYYANNNEKLNACKRARRARLRQAQENPND